MVPLVLNNTNFKLNTHHIDKLQKIPSISIRLLFHYVATQGMTLMYYHM